MPHQEHKSCIEACVECAQACEHCADACLDEESIDGMIACIRLDKDCAAICWQAAGFMSRGSEFADSLCALCADICEACADQCSRFENDHCRACAQACRRCEQECRSMAGAAHASR